MPPLQQNQHRRSRDDGVKTHSRRSNRKSASNTSKIRSAVSFNESSRSQPSTKKLSKIRSSSIAPLKITVERHRYKETSLFEQSLDIYRPIHDSFSDLRQDRRPLVVLVVGSAWLGHQPFVYAGTSWWNASGPKTIASNLGCTCVCIRHRGAFPKLAPEGDVVFAALVGGVLAMQMCLMGVAFKLYQNYGVETALRDHFMECMIVALFMAFTATYLLLLIAGRGDAELPNMWDDVADAMKWVQDHRMDLDGGKSPLIFGGYSSGGHVASTLLQRPHLWRTKGLPDPSVFIDGVLYLSGVLAVREWPKISRNDRSHPSWLASLITQVVFGGRGKASLPSPLHDVVTSVNEINELRSQSNVAPPPSIPHLLVGCKYEVFGIDWMDVMFASRPYAEALVGYAPAVEYLEVNSNHWNVLNSSALATSLQYGLCEWMMDKIQKKG